MTNEADKPGVRGFFKRLRAKLNQGPAWLTADLTELLPGRQIDAEILDELETRLITADVGTEATRRILAESPRIAVVILSMHQDESYILRSLKAGAKGYLLKDSLRADVIEAIRAVAQGRSFLTRKIGRMLQEDYVRQLESRGLDDTYDLLTDREREILQLVAEGRTNKEVARLLNVSLTSVETNRTHILQKLGLHSVPELILYAVRKGIIS